MSKSKKQKIIDYAKTIGINYLGVCDAHFDKNLYAILNKRREEGKECDFTHEDLLLRSSPDLVVPGAKSVIVCLFPYHKQSFTRGNISRYASVTDYHKVALSKLDLVAGYINENIEKCECLCFSDTGTCVDRFLAYKAGLGFFGKNNCLINDELGSFFFVGYIITTCEIDCDLPLFATCIDCGECIKNCPGGALDNNYCIDPNKCISYITQIKEMSKEQEELLSKQNSVYGCDVCQDVCPHNKNLKDTILKEFAENEINELCYDEFCDMSNKSFRKKYKKL